MIQKRPNKSIPQNLIMAEAVPFGQRWTYHAPHPIDEIKSPEYFKSEGRFRAGDDIRMIEIKDNEVVAFCDAIVIKADPLEFKMTRRVTKANGKKDEPEELVANG